LLLTNGCSFVWGDELPGWDDEPPSHWDHTFTHKLGGLLDMPYENLGTCGASNEKIFRDTLSYLMDPEKEDPTHMAILWSAWQRNEFAENRSVEFETEANIKRWQCMTQISPTRLHNLRPDTRRTYEEALFYIDTDRTGVIQGLSKIQAMELICESRGIKLIQGTFHKRCYENILNLSKPRYRMTDEPWTEWIDFTQGQLKSLKDTSRQGLGKGKSFFEIGGDEGTIQKYGHPCEKGHTAYAKVLHELFETGF
jgi:hypothetical protein